MLNKLRPRVITCSNIVKQRDRALPAPKGLPVVGNALQIDSERMHQLCTKWSKYHGNLFQLNIFRKRVVVISDVNVLRTAFSISYHMNDRSINSVSYVYKDRKHIGFADYCEQTVALRHILNRHVLSYQMNRHVLHKCTRVAVDNLVDKYREKQDIDTNIFIKEFLTDLNSIVVSSIL